MKPEPRSRLSFGLLCAAIPALTFAQVAFYAWIGWGPRALEDWRWFAAGTVVFIALLIAAGFIVIGDESAAAATAPSRYRPSTTPARQRIAWILLLAALLAYFFYRSAFGSWWRSATLGFRWFGFQEWYWWVGALFVCLAFLTAAAFVAFGNERGTLERATTPIEDTSHRLLIDEHGNELAEAPRREGEVIFRMPGTLDAARATAARTPPNIRGSRPLSSWLQRFAVATVTALVLTSLGLTREVASEVLAVLAMTVSVAFAVWVFVRNR